MLQMKSSDASVNSDDSTNTEGEELGDREKNSCIIKTGNLLHSILTEGTQGSFPGSIYQPTLKGFERMTVADKSDEQKPAVDPRQYCTTASVLAAPQDADLENGIDFGYSQKFFHIADGNLYSVFSPLQGRSYGGKPSFLRKQRCTIRESQGRGRKSLKKGLKFHNFLPSESITSEKEDKILTGEGETWKVHAECRLREEHGTKQIMVSNWSVSGGNISETYITEEGSSSQTLTTYKEEKSLSSINSITQPEQLSRKLPDINTFPSHRTEKPTVYSEPKDSGKGTELKAIVDRLVMIPHTTTKPRPVKESASRKISLHNKHNANGMLAEDSTNYNGVNNNGKKSPIHYQHYRRQRRKPLQTKKIVPYNEYLTMLEESESKPLDLSYQTSLPLQNEACSLLHHLTAPATKDSDVQCISDSINTHENSNIQMTLSNREHSAEINYSNSSPTETANDSKKSLVLLNPCVNICESPSPSSVTYVCPVSLLLGQKTSSSTNIQEDDKADSPFNKMSQVSETQNITPNLAIMPQTTVSPSSAGTSRSKSNNEAQKSHVSKPRGRSNQRTMIRKKLEDTFRQNGFLVKTKQVTDGEATFCKFRQLRKYTRHYLKSWHHHLPEEVHKLWKGFLPSKTALPPSTGGKIALTKELSSLNSFI